MPRSKPRERADPEAPKGRAAEAGRQPAVNKTVAIRTLIEEWTQAGQRTAPKTLTEELKRRYPTEEWSLAYVSSTKSKLKKRQPPQAPAAPPVGEGNPLRGRDAVELVLAVKSLAKQAGGLDQLKKLIEALQADH
jgi:hypothetical protein